MSISTCRCQCCLQREKSKWFNGFDSIYLRERLKQANEVIKFYADSRNWYWDHGDSNKCCDKITRDDIERSEFDHDGTGGAKARAFLLLNKPTE